MSLDLKPASVTRMTDILYKRRLMDRSDYHDDRRVVMIQLTEEGEELLQKAAVQYAEKAAILYQQLNTADLQYLRKLAESLTKLANGCAVKNGK